MTKIKKGQAASAASSVERQMGDPLPKTMSFSDKVDILVPELYAFHQILDKQSASDVDITMTALKFTKCITELFKIPSEISVDSLQKIYMANALIGNILYDTAHIELLILWRDAEKAAFSQAKIFATTSEGVKEEQPFMKEERKKWLEEGNAALQHFIHSNNGASSSASSVSASSSAQGTRFNRYCDNISHYVENLSDTPEVRAHARHIFSTLYAITDSAQANLLPRNLQLEYCQRTIAFLEKAKELHFTDSDFTFSATYPTLDDSIGYFQIVCKVLKEAENIEKLGKMLSQGKENTGISEYCERINTFYTSETINPNTQQLLVPALRDIFKKMKTLPLDNASKEELTATEVLVISKDPAEHAKKVKNLITSFNKVANECSQLNNNQEQFADDEVGIKIKGLCQRIRGIYSENDSIYDSVLKERVETTENHLDILAKIAQKRLIVDAEADCYESMVVIYPRVGLGELYGSSIALYQERSKQLRSLLPVSDPVDTINRYCAAIPRDMEELRQFTVTDAPVMTLNGFLNYFVCNMHLSTYQNVMNTLIDTLEKAEWRKVYDGSYRFEFDEPSSLRALPLVASVVEHAVQQSADIIKGMADAREIRGYCADARELFQETFVINNTQFSPDTVFIKSFAPTLYRTLTILAHHAEQRKDSVLAIEVMECLANVCANVSYPVNANETIKATRKQVALQLARLRAPAVPSAEEKKDENTLSVSDSASEAAKPAAVKSPSPTRTTTPPSVPNTEVAAASSASQSWVTVIGGRRQKQPRGAEPAHSQAASSVISAAKKTAKGSSTNRTTASHSQPALVSVKQSQAESSPVMTIVPTSVPSSSPALAAAAALSPSEISTSSPQLQTAAHVAPEREQSASSTPTQSITPPSPVASPAAEQKPTRLNALAREYTPMPLQQSPLLPTTPNPPYQVRMLQPPVYDHNAAIAYYHYQQHMQFAHYQQHMQFSQQGYAAMMPQPQPGYSNQHPRGGGAGGGRGGRNK